MCGDKVGGMKESNPAARQAREYGVDYTPSKEAGQAGEKTDVKAPGFLEKAANVFTQNIASMVPGLSLFAGEVMTPGGGTISKAVDWINRAVGYDPTNPENAAAYDKYETGREAARNARSEGSAGLDNNFGIKNILKQPTVASGPPTESTTPEPDAIDLTGKRGEKIDLATLLALRGIRGKGLKSYRA